MREVESHAARSGWDQPAQIFAIVETADLLEREPHLAEILGIDAQSQVLTPVEQETTVGQSRGAARAHPVAAGGGRLCRGVWRP